MHVLPCGNLFRWTFGFLTRGFVKHVGLIFVILIHLFISMFLSTIFLKCKYLPRSQVITAKSAQQPYLLLSIQSVLYKRPIRSSTRGEVTGTSELTVLRVQCLAVSVNPYLLHCTFSVYTPALGSAVVIWMSGEASGSSWIDWIDRMLTLQ